MLSFSCVLSDDLSSTSKRFYMGGVTLEDVSFRVGHDKQKCTQPKVQRQQLVHCVWCIAPEKSSQVKTKPTIIKTKQMCHTGDSGSYNQIQHLRTDRSSCESIQQRYIQVYGSFTSFDRQHSWTKTTINPKRVPQKDRIKSCLVFVASDFITTGISFSSLVQP